MRHLRCKEELRAILGHPAPTTPLKMHHKQNQRAIDFIEESPLLFLASTKASGFPTVSPRGTPRASFE
jgi:hypothetical protein